MNMRTLWQIQGDHTATRRLLDRIATKEGKIGKIFKPSIDGGCSIQRFDQTSIIMNLKKIESY